MATAWDERIAEALRAGGFQDDVKRSAMRWDTCPIAEWLSPIERQFVAIPPLRHDPLAIRWHEFGISFNRAVQADDPREARRLLDEMREWPAP